jgi:hypothetical protein
VVLRDYTYPMQTNKRTQGMRALNYRKLGKAELDMLAEVRVGDVMMGMLFSACSVRSIQRAARARAKERRARVDIHQRTLAALMRKGLLYITMRVALKPSHSPKNASIEAFFVGLSCTRLEFPAIRCMDYQKNPHHAYRFPHLRSVSRIHTP